MSEAPWPSAYWKIAMLAPISKGGEHHDEPDARPGARRADVCDIAGSTLLGHVAPIESRGLTFGFSRRPIERWPQVSCGGGPRAGPASGSLRNDLPLVVTNSPTRQNVLR